MKKIKISELFNNSAYHETTADDELIRAIISQSQKSSGGGKIKFIKSLIVTLAILLLAALIYRIYTLLGTTRFGEINETIVTTWAVETWNYNENREQDLLEDVRDILLDQEEEL